MLKVAILDDYQNVSQQFVNIEKLSGKYEIKIFKLTVILFQNTWMCCYKIKVNYLRILTNVRYIFF